MDRTKKMPMGEGVSKIRKKWPTLFMADPLYAGPFEESVVLLFCKNMILIGSFHQF